MHEMSIAGAIWNLALSHVPPDATLRFVHVKAGPMRGIEPQSMEWAWQALMADEGDEHIGLKLTTLPWRMRCAVCERQWEADELEERCQCGCGQVRLVGGDELQLVSIEVDEAPRSARLQGSAS